MRILTNKLTYKTVETIEISLFLKDTLITLDYAGKTTQAADNANVIANPSYDLVIVEVRMKSVKDC